MMLAALPLGLGMALAALVGLVAAGFVNWAVYWLAWNRRPVSPWSVAPRDATPRNYSDRLPLWGWWRLRRESELHGRGFWVRPVLVELAMAAGWAALYWWEVGEQGLVRPQFEAIAGGPLPHGLVVAPLAITLARFASHALLLTLMAAASLIDIDEKTIPDGITTPGTLLGLVLAALVPMSLLPHAALRSAAPIAGTVITLPPGGEEDGRQLFVEPLTLVSPHGWPAELAAAPNWLSLAIGLACYFVWCFALTPRIWRGRRGFAVGLRVISARIVRELLRPPLAGIGVGGAAAIIAVWLVGGAAWVGLLTALVGMIGSGLLVWAVRIAGRISLRKEALGFGDVTLMMMIGAFLGWQPSVFIFFIAPFAALVIGALQLVLRRDDVIPYGPFLCLGALVVIVRWGEFWNADARSLQAFFDFGWLVPSVLAVGILMLGAMLTIWRNIKEMFGWGLGDVE